MKYEGLRKLESTVTERDSVVCQSVKMAASGSDAIKSAATGSLGEMSVATEAAAESITVCLPEDEHVVFAKTSAKKADDNSVKPPVKKKSFFFTFLKQVAICAAVVGGLVLLKFIDSGFSTEVFKGVKDIVSYNFEIPGISS